MVSQSTDHDVPPWLPEHLIGGHPALDFVNTLSHRADPALAVDRFNSLDKIAGWCEHAGLLEKSVARRLTRDLHTSETDLVKRLTKLRTAGGRVFDAVAAGHSIPSDAVAAVARIAGDTISKLHLECHDEGPRTIAPKRIANPDALVALIAMQILDALYRLPPGRIKACPGCHWLFVDRSRPGRRKWCSMSDCGNRDKVRRYYMRHR